MPACKSTAAEVTAMKIVRFSIASLRLRVLGHSHCREYRLRSRATAFGPGNLLISLLASLIGGTKLLLLLIEYLAPSIRPFTGLLPSLARLLPHEIPSLLGFGS